MNKWFNKHMKFVFLAPSIIFILLMIVAPLAYNFALSFTDWTMSVNKAPNFIGLANYIEVFKEPRFISSV